MHSLPCHNYKIVLFVIYHHHVIFIRSYTCHTCFKTLLIKIDDVSMQWTIPIVHGQQSYYCNFHNILQNISNYYKFSYTNVTRNGVFKELCTSCSDVYFQILHTFVSQCTKRVVTMLSLSHNHITLWQSCK